ncbi:MAG: condensation domain-containing protein [Planctomycetota bacterium]
MLPESSTVPLTPTQNWLFERELQDPHNYNLAWLYKLPANVEFDLLEESLVAAYRHHKCDLLRYSRDGDLWTQSYGGSLPITIDYVDTSGVPAGYESQFIVTKAVEYRRSLNLTCGPLGRAVLFKFTDNSCPLLLWVVSHLIWDGRSQSIFIACVESIYHYRTNGGKKSLRTTQHFFADWARHFYRYGQLDSTIDLTDYWCSQRWVEIQSMADGALEFENTYEESSILSVALPGSLCDKLRRCVPRLLYAQSTAAVLAAVSEALCKWTKASLCAMDMTVDGRTRMFNELDVRHSIGYYTVHWPLLVDLTSCKEASVRRSIMQIWGQYLEAFRHGPSFGALRYLCEDDRIRCAMAQIPDLEIKFNYLEGNTPRPQSDKLLIPSAEKIGGVLAPNNRRKYILNIEIRNHLTAMDISIKYNRILHKEEQISHLLFQITSFLNRVVHDC